MGIAHKTRETNENNFPFVFFRVFRGRIIIIFSAIPANPALPLVSKLSVAMVINPSPMPITAWIPAMAGKTIFKGAVPEMLNSKSATGCR